MRDTGESFGIKFHLQSSDGDSGFPGNCQIELTVILDNQNQLQMIYSAETDKATPMNLTNHTYWNLSGDCNFDREFNRGNINPLQLGGAGARCVRRRAQLSVAMHPGCPDDETARLAVDRAWSTCFFDRAPFDDHACQKDDL